MKRQSKAVVILLLTAIFCMMFANAVLAADETSSAWFTMTPSDGGDATVSVVTNASLTDGVVTLTYDASRLTYKGITVDETRVAMYSVNDSESGVIKISWVAPNEPEADGSDAAFINLAFSGDAENAGEITLTGSASYSDGSMAEISSEADYKESDSSAADTDDETTSASDDTSAAADSTDAADSTGDSSAETPTTGDNTPVVLFVVLAAVSAACLAVICVTNKRRHEK